MYFQVSPPSAIDLMTKSQGSQWEGWSRITAFVAVDAAIALGCIYRYCAVIDGDGLILYRNQR